ncbi:MAG: tRNA (adenosine(37)-N6)-threonylcarbamoyltransferase complex dimerization subunit type 1 TsaB [Chthoniobacterales bacterium]
MKILALELSSVRGSLAWRDGDSKLTREWPNDRKNSGEFFRQLSEVQQRFGAANRIVVGLGPGSYAGTRISISTAIGLQVASKAELVGLPSLYAIDCDVAEYAVIGDARRQTFFFARIKDRSLLEAPGLRTESELREVLRSCSSHMPVFATEPLPQFEGVTLRYPSAEILARLAEDANRAFVLPPLEPMYLREPHITTPKTK